MNRAQLLERYEEARLAQAEFWNALSALEEAIGFEIDGTRDLTDTNVDALLLAEEIARECDNGDDDLDEDEAAHEHVGAGRCDVCGHYGDDCTGKLVAS